MYLFLDELIVFAAVLSDWFFFLGWKLFNRICGGFELVKLKDAIY